MKSKRETAANSDQTTSIRRPVKCPNCKWPFMTNKKEPQCAKCGVRFFQV